MALKRLKPLINRRDLGFVRLWQDELAEIVRLMRQLDDVDVYVEADDYVIDDIETDLPQIGSKRVKYFKAIVKRADENGQAHSIMRLELSRKISHIEAEDPDLQTLGAMNAIISLTDRCQRLPHGRLSNLLRGGYGLSWPLVTFTSILVTFLAYLILYSITLVITYGIASNKAVQLPHPLIIPFWVISVLFGITWFIGATQAKVTMYTGTRAEAPTWWQEHRSDIAINVSVSVLSLVVGVLIGHL